MTYEELLGWFDYFERRPAEWRGDERAAKLLQAQGVKEKAINLFPSLAAIYKPRTTSPGNFDVSGFKASLMFQKMLSSTKGDKLDL